MDRKSEPTRFEKQARQRIKQLIEQYCDGSQQELSNKTGVAKASISQYVNGKNVPSNITAKKLSAPFGINPAWLMGFDVPKEENQEESPKTTAYYLDPETAAIAQEVFDNPELRILFSAARDVKPENIQLAAEMLKRMKETNPDG